jgi:hypothetical protein
MSRPVKVALAVAAVALSAVVLTYVIPPFFVADRTSLPASTRWQALSAARTMFIQLLGGVALLAGLYFTGKTYWLARLSHRNDRFATAIDNLGKDSEAARAGGAYILYLLASEESTYWPIVEQVLVNVIRERVAQSAAGGGSTRGHADVQAALTVLGQRPHRASGQKGRPLNLRGIDLGGYDLTGANLDRVYLQRSTLADATLADATLVEASLDDAVLDGADLSGADFSAGSLCRASFHRADLYHAILTDALVDGAQFSGANNVAQGQLDTAIGSAASLP